MLIMLTDAGLLTDRVLTFKSVGWLLSMFTRPLGVPITLTAAGPLFSKSLTLKFGTRFSGDNNLDLRNKLSSLSLRIMSSCLRIIEARSLCLDRRALISDTRSLRNRDSKVAMSAFKLIS